MARMGAQQAEIPVREMPLGARASASLSFAAQGPSLATSPISRCDGSSRLSGICTASAPPGLELVDERREERLVVRNPLQHGIGEDHVERLFGRHSRMSATSKASREDACAPLRSCRGKNRGRRCAPADSTRARLRSNCPDRSRCRRRSRLQQSEFAPRDHGPAGCAHVRI